MNLCGLSAEQLLSPSWCTGRLRGEALRLKPKIDRLEAAIKRAKRGSLYDSNGPSLVHIMEEADSHLFSKILTNPNHVLAPILPPPKVVTHSLRARVHNRTLPPKTTLSVKNFLLRLLYRDIY